MMTWKDKTLKLLKAHGPKRPSELAVISRHTAKTLRIASASYANVLAALAKRGEVTLKREGYGSVYSLPDQNGNGKPWASRGPVKPWTNGQTTSPAVLFNKWWRESGPLSAALACGFELQENERIRDEFQKCFVAAYQLAQGE